MIAFDKAVEIVNSHSRHYGTESISLKNSVGRVLAREIRTDCDIPRWNLSAMDGYACRMDDVDKPLRVIETIPAGKAPCKNVKTGECSRIMTGAIVPHGADTVVMFEHAVERNGIVTVNKKSDRRNIRYKAEDMKKGDSLLVPGTIITPAIVAVMASAGCISPVVYRRLKVGVIATGDELVEPGKKPSEGQIRNSNGWQLCAQVRSTGCIAKYFGIARDKPAVIDKKLKTALADCDVILLSGGVSAGDFDYVPDILRKNGIKLLFEKVAVKPGKPTVFGIKGKKILFGLPGNPVSTFVLFEMLVKPFLMRCMGATFNRISISARLGEAFCRKKADRMEFRPVKFGIDGRAYGVDYHGSAHIHSFTQAQGIIEIPEGVFSLDCGESVMINII